MSNTILRKLNWKHILLHLLAIYFIKQSGFHLSFLTDIELLNVISSGNEGPEAISEDALINRRMALLTTTGILTGSFMIAGFLLSLFLTIKRKWFWLNAVIALGVLMLISYLMLLENLGLSDLIVSISRLTNSIFWTYLLSGLLFLVCGLVLFLLPSVNRFIQGSNKRERQETFQFEKINAEV